jgi:hypothetical protein
MFHHSISHRTKKDEFVNRSKRREIKKKIERLFLLPETSQNSSKVPYYFGLEAVKKRRN